MAIASLVLKYENDTWSFSFHMSQTPLSPVTGIIDESMVILDFGTHQGRSIKEIQEIDPEFYESLVLDKGEGVYAIKREAHIDGHKTFRLYLNPLAQMDQ